MARSLLLRQRKSLYAKVRLKKHILKKMVKKLDQTLFSLLRMGKKKDKK